MSKIIEITHEDVIIRSFMLFIQTSRAISKYSDGRFFKDLRLSIVKYIALKAISINGEILCITDLANWTGTERHNITTLIDRMKRDGLVSTERNDEDRRVVNIKLTEKGHDLVGKANMVARDIINDVMSGVSKRDAAKLERLMVVLSRNIKDS